MRLFSTFVGCSIKVQADQENAKLIYLFWVVPMDESKKRIREIFDEAIKIVDEAERRQFLEKACEGQDDVKREVELLLSASENASGLSATKSYGEPKRPVVSDYSTKAHEEFDPVGSIVAGKFMLLENIGEGGMGSVWMADQREPIRRKVAIKLIKAGMDSKQILARFEAERQALALMDHPNIARVFDAGMTEEGRPYFAMELIRGVSLTKYCDQIQLPIRGRLELFLQVCKAIQHAHQKGIIHRDLKPSNVLVTELDGKPVVKVIDFGLAKAIHGPQILTDLSFHTAFGAVLGTPLYMAPEQLGTSAIDVDTRSDLYSLGVILYELLTGTTPIERQRLNKAAWDEVCRLIREEEPPLPSTRLSSSDKLPSLAAQRHIEPAKLTRMVRGELDWIIMKTLEKERSRRYETATGLSNDIQRFLDGEAVMAAPASKLYRVRKFVKRNQKTVLAASLLLVILLGGIAGTSYGMFSARIYAENERLAKVDAEEKRRTADEQRQRAEQREQEAIDAVKRFGDTIRENDELKNSPQLESLRNKLLREPIAFFKKLKEQIERDRNSDPDSIFRLSKVAVELGTLSDEIGDKNDAIVFFTENVRILRRLNETEQISHKFAVPFAESFIRLGALYRDTGQFLDAETNLKESKEFLESIVKKFPRDREVSEAFASCLYGLGHVYRSIGKNDEALREMKLALEAYEQLESDFVSDTTYSKGTGSCCYSLALFLHSRGQFEEAASFYEAAIAKFDSLVAEHPKNKEFKHALGLCKSDFAGKLTKPGTFERAKLLLDEALEIQTELAEESPTVTDYQSNLANTYFLRGMLLFPMDKPQDAIEAYKQAISIRESLAEEHPSVLRFRYNLSSSSFMFAKFLIENNKPSEALPYMRKAYASISGLIHSGAEIYRQDFSNTANGYGIVLNQLGEKKEAAKLFREAIDSYTILMKNNPERIDLLLLLSGCHFNLAGVLENVAALSSLAEYQEGIRIVASIVENSPTSDHKMLLADRHLLLTAFLRRVEIPELSESVASKIFAEAFLNYDEILKEHPSRNDMKLKLSKCQENSGGYYRRIEKHDKSELAFSRAVEIRKQLVAENPDNLEFLCQLGGALNNFAELKISLLSFVEAKELLEQAVEYQEKALEINPNDLVANQYLDLHLINLDKVAAYLGDVELGKKTREGSLRRAKQNPDFEALESLLAKALEDELPTDATQLIQLAEQATTTMRYKLATKLYSRAFELAPSLIEDRTSQHQYNAACAAVLAARDHRLETIQGEESPEEYRLRSVHWLKSELELHDKSIEVDSDQQLNFVPSILNHWRTDRDLSSVRDTSEINRLSERENKEFNTLWTSVKALSAKATRANHTNLGLK